MLKLVNKKTNDISVSDMKDGELAIITTWWNDPNACYVGTIVQRYKNILIAVGLSEEKSCRSIFSDNDQYDDCRVRLLKKGETLVVD